MDSANQTASRPRFRRRVMGFLKHFRHKGHDKEKHRRSHSHAGPYNNHTYAAPIDPTRNFTARLPDKVLDLIFKAVCPHTADESYEVTEKSMIGDGCMLCDLRDLSNCAQVSKKWHRTAQPLLYRSVRIDAVHYCELEDILSDTRRRKSRHEPVDLLARTVRENQYLAETVLLLKLPYMTRETYKADLARTISVLPNLHYVDLPDGFYTGDQSCHTLRQELQASCRGLRKMKYDTGSEQLFELLLQGFWQQLEVLELSRLRVEPMTLRQVIAILPNLKELTVSEMPWLGDAVFEDSPAVAPFPPVERLTFQEMPTITANGLLNYLSHRENSTRLRSLKLASTGVNVADLHAVMSSAPWLRNLDISATVTTALPMEARPPLRSLTLRVLHFEITSASTAFQGLQPPDQSYYGYLITSLLTNSMPSLKELYVRDPNFAETLTLAPPMPAYAQSEGGAPRSLSQPLQIYTKGMDELDWIFTSYTPAEEAGRRGSFSGGRPLSAFNAHLGPQWGGDNRRSMVVGNGFGGFLAVPMDEPERPKTSGSMKGHARHDSAKRASRADLWR
ncbi:uncharacterized protein K452DRAFT_352034 [Aplosporella prunicola CBS 121167]|uniref:F-box domain-containing protein n=1 Tax=Aplosporella prunicola CBS 121167 TaxID=1176127 RepID=A0A6A6BCN8_9PEZI|nr:uncharacterized protein K452DRAFT_352034 [Aplosporella prunicola CBS 121167]KAF2140251.1 hypothetical protein K452DRAFT_352034 [Aplosporella prunicola CBS 121167]